MLHTEMIHFISYVVMVNGIEWQQNSDIYIYIYIYIKATTSLSIYIIQVNTKIVILKTTQKYLQNILYFHIMLDKIVCYY